MAKNITIDIIQKRPNKKTGDPGNPKLFIPSNLGENTEETLAFFKLLKKDSLTIDDINDIRQINITYNPIEGLMPIGGKLIVMESCMIWRDTKGNRYYGRKLDHRGYLEGEHTFGSNPDDVYKKLIIDEWYKEPKEKITKKDLIEMAENRRNENE